MHCRDKNLSAQHDVGFYESDRLSPHVVPHLRARQLCERLGGMASWGFRYLFVALGSQ
jgi:hypothetical protein